MKQPQPYGAENHGEDAGCACGAECTAAREAAVRATVPNTAQTPSFAGNAVEEGWTQIADCEARNALQVILSGSEILLEDLFGRLLPDQKLMLEKILASAHRLTIIIATLTRPNDLVGGPVSGNFAPKELFLANRRIREAVD